MTCCAGKCSKLQLSKGQVWEGAHHGFFSMEGVNCICDDIFGTSCTTHTWARGTSSTWSRCTTSTWTWGTCCTRTWTCGASVIGTSGAWRNGLATLWSEVWTQVLCGQNWSTAVICRHQSEVVWPPRWFPILGQSCLARLYQRPHLTRQHMGRQLIRIWPPRPQFCQSLQLLNGRTSPDKTQASGSLAYFYSTTIWIQDKI